MLYWFRWWPSLQLFSFNMYGKKIVGVVPILLGLIVGYIFSVALGFADRT